MPRVAIVLVHGVSSDMVRLMSRLQLIRKRVGHIVLLGISSLMLLGCAEAVVLGGVTAVVAWHDARTVKAMIRDQDIENTARGLLKRDAALAKNTRITISSFNGTVLMTGQASDKQVKKTAQDRVAAISGVRRVESAVTINARLSGSGVYTNSQLISKIKSRLAFRDFDASRVRVIPEKEAVYLMGQVTHAESEDAIKIVQNVEGVTSVIGIFEYVD